MVERAPQTEATSLEMPFPVFMPGATSRGPRLTALRLAFDERYGHANALIPSSISEAEGLKKDETLTTHYENLASETITKANGKDIVLIGHSMGGWEAYYLAKAILDNPSWTGKKLHVAIASPLGFDTKGAQGPIRIIRQAMKVENQSFDEQHIDYPLPEAYYEGEPQVARPQGTTVIFRDDKESRAARRDEVVKITQRIVGNSVSDPVFAAVGELDKRIVYASSIKNYRYAAKLLRQRGRLLDPHLLALCRGEQFSQQQHQPYEEEYRETPPQLASKRAHALQYSAFLLRTIGKDAVTGMTKKLKELAEQNKEKEVTFSFHVLERDSVAPPSIVHGIKQQVRRAGIPVKGYTFTETHSHGSISIWPELATTIYEHTARAMNS